MTKLVWDKPGEHYYETGVDQGVLYVVEDGSYGDGVAWNGLTQVTESPSGAEPQAIYADNIKYLNLLSAEEFGGTIEAYTYPDEWGVCDGTASPAKGVSVGQQSRRTFGLSYRTRIGNDEDQSDHGYKIHLVWGALAAPSEKAYATINDTPEAITLSWTFSTTPVPVTDLKPTAIITISSLDVAGSALAELEAILHGDDVNQPRLPSPDEIIGMFADADEATVVTPVQPEFVSASGVITIPEVAGVVYRRMDTNVVVEAGPVTITDPGDSLLIRAFPLNSSFKFPAMADDDWSFTRDE